MTTPDSGPGSLRARRFLPMTAMVLAATIAAAATADEADPLVARGRYMVQIAGCNDCHTADYIFKEGAIDESLWLRGNPIGWNGPWGTTYPPNLRLTVQNLTEEQWLVFARAPRRPPMPWFAVRDMSDEDVTAIYRYLKHVGPAGQPAPAALPPGAEPPGPVFRAPEQPPAK